MRNHDQDLGAFVSRKMAGGSPAAPKLGGRDRDQDMKDFVRGGLRRIGWRDFHEREAERVLADSPDPTAQALAAGHDRWTLAGWELLDPDQKERARAGDPAANEAWRAIADYLQQEAVADEENESDVEEAG